MTEDDLSRRIAEALARANGWTQSDDGWHKQERARLSVATGARAIYSADYATDLNASMAVIRERWPEAVVELRSHWAYIWYAYPSNADSSIGSSDASRLAHTLLQALEREAEQ